MNLKTLKSNLMSIQKYAKGERVKVLCGHRIWHFKKGVVTAEDIAPYLTEDTATVDYTYGQMSETDFKFTKGEGGYKRYALIFDNYGWRAWFDEENLIPA